MRALLALGACALVLAGCGGAEDPTQRFARRATESYLAGNPAYDLGRIYCTGNPRPWLVERQATESICAVRRSGGGCDWYHVELVPTGTRVTARVRLEAEDAGCTVS